MIVRKMRPRFRVPVSLSPDEVVGRIGSRLDAPDAICRGMIAGNHHVVELRVLDRDRHFWSPALTVTVAEGEDGTSTVHGLVGPDPAVWTLFAMIYLGLWTALVFVAIFGLIQWSLGMPAWALWIVPAIVVGLLGMYGLSRLGQRLAAPQTIVLRHFLEEALELPEAERVVTERDPYHRDPVSG